MGSIMSKKRLDILDRKVDILQWISENKTNKFICIELRCTPATLSRHLGWMGIVYNGNSVSINDVRTKYRRTAMSYIETGDSVSSNVLRRKLLEDGIFDYECGICKITEWMGEPVPLELDHINGDHYDNSLDNLRIICANCHRQTPTYGSKTRDCIKRILNCVECGAEFTSTNNRTCCSDLCSSKRLISNVECTDNDVLDALLSTKLKNGRLNYKGASGLINLSDNGIRKRIKRMEVHSPELYARIKEETN